MKAREILRIIERDGWRISRQKGSHRQYKHLYKKGVVTLSFHGLSDDVAPGTLNSIFKQAGIEPNKR